MLVTLGILTFLFTHQTNAASLWGPQQVYSVNRYVLPVYSNPAIQKKPLFYIYKGMNIEPTDISFKNGYKWFKIGLSDYWVPALEPSGRANLLVNRNPNRYKMIDMYGILNLPHQYAVKLVKLKGAKGRLETYKKVGDKYLWKKSYEVKYPKEGPKNIYGDLKTVGGPVIRYLYRTTRSGMNGYNKNHKRFGVYKVSYPMPHDGLAYLVKNKMTISQYNNLPTINYQKNNELYPHPGSMLGADIVIHTAKKGTIGCIILENELMSDLYYRDLVTKNNTEIIPFIIYDEGMKASVEGKLF